MRNNPTGAMGLRDYLGWKWTSQLGLPVVNLPGCPAQPDNITELLLCLVLYIAEMGPAPELDDQGRPRRLFDRTVHEACNRSGMAEQGEFARAHGDSRCLVKLGCQGPVVKCNVPLRGWSGGLGGCPNVGGICIGCTMPGFPDKFMPFMDEPPGGKLSASLIGAYGKTVRALRAQTVKTLDKEPKWRVPGRQLLTGAKRTW